MPETSHAPLPPADTLSAALAATLAARLGTAFLGEEETPEPEALAQAAHFLREAAASRAPGLPALAIEPFLTATGQRLTRIAVINDDMPFLVDTIAGAVSTEGLAIERLAHPVLAAERDGAGRLAALPAGDVPGTARESFVYLETARANARTRGRLATGIQRALADGRAAVADWEAMRAAMAADAATLARQDRSEAAALLRWLAADMFTLLGHVRHTRDGGASAALGICRASTPAPLPPEALAEAFAWCDAFMAGGGGRLPLIVKSDHLALVHRRVPLDLFIVPEIAGGRVEALSIHAGLWTSAALASPPAQVPLMRAQLATLMGKFGFASDGHAGKVLAHALTSLPHDQLIAFSDDDLERVALAMMSLLDRPRPRLALVAAPMARQLFAFIWLPRDMFSTDVREAITRLLVEATGARVLDWSLEVESSGLAQLRFVLARSDHAAPGAPAAPAPAGTAPARAPADEAALDAQLGAMLRGWDEAVEAELAHSLPPRRAAAVAARYAGAFPPAYRSLYGPAQAAIDIGHLRHLVARKGQALRRAVRLYALASDPPERLRLKIYQATGALVLSEVVPALENFGFRVIDTMPTHLAMASHGQAPAQGGLGTIHDILLALPAPAPDAPASHPADSARRAVLHHAPIVEDALGAMLNGAGEDDPFNRLIVGVGLSAREANWLRALYRYLRQAGMSQGVDTAVDALMRAPVVALALVDLLRARHQPGIDGRAAAEALAEATLSAGLGEVAAIQDDRLLRAFGAAVRALLRTNAFSPASTQALAFKFDSALVPGLPRPLPWREIFVYAPEVEGIHLRAGPVARGGLRWSDRRDDFRTEVLGLMKAQRVKNAVIVPTGAKGGFFPKHLPDPATHRAAWAEGGRAAYQTFVRALLSLTDNLVDGQLVHPAGITIRDGADPYFVVAADKGTATFSDTANAIAAEAGFWLGDAFASGGSVGYDHKAMGITARGAWVSVQRHFREMGVDVQAEPVRVAGVGDMSGDVFGNGMLLSKAICLVAAFDHRHIFLDPAPDPATAWAERARLFALPRSSWADYDSALISKGGGVFARSLKSIPLSPEARAALGTEAETIEPDALIRAILTASVDLLWFGGIGTYVKAASQSDAEAGDRTNDALRVNGAQLRARVVGEGANLGVTQAGRIEYALAGGRINTDFIDNSAGVDCSDKEVNIKIALASARRAGRLAEADRPALLAGMTDAVAELVLDDNRQQALGLSVAQGGGVAAVPAYLRLIDQLEEAGQLDRATEGLADAETFTRRAAGHDDGQDGRGLTRPELAVLLSSAKLALQAALEAAPLLDDPELTPLFAPLLAAAFPEAMRRGFAADIAGHQLRREILATGIANRVVNRLGLLAPFELAEEEGVGLADVAAACLAAEALFGMAPLWRAIDTGVMPEAARIALMGAAAAGLRGHMSELLRAEPAAPMALASALGPTIAELADERESQQEPAARAQSAARLAALTDAGAPVDLAISVNRLADMAGAVGLAYLAHGRRCHLPALAQAFARLGTALDLDWAEAAAARLAPADPWERLLAGGLARDFQQMRLARLARLAEGDPLGEVERWLAAHEPAAERLRLLAARARQAPRLSPAMLAQIARQARILLAP